MYHVALPVGAALRPGAHESVRRPGTWLGYTANHHGVTTSMCCHNHPTATEAMNCATAMVALAN